MASGNEREVILPIQATDDTDYVVPHHSYYPSHYPTDSSFDLSRNVGRTNDTVSTLTTLYICDILRLTIDYINNGLTE